jgi:hypothetical protein
VLLPSIARRVAGSLIILFHFLGITTAVTTVEGTAPWLSQQSWGHVYRPYLQFLHLFNAYHFYSPNPGPTTLVWFRVEYKSGKKPQWVKLPVKENSPVPLHYTRRLALGMSLEAAMQPLPQQVLEQPDADLPRDVRPPVRAYRALRKRRETAGALDQVPSRAFQLQYFEPTPNVKKLLGSYARHVARTTPNPDDPDDEVARVRVYRVTQQIPEPGLVAEKGAGVVTDKTLYLPIYLGEFDREGTLQDGWEFDNEILKKDFFGEDDLKRAIRKEGDPYLYWVLPIISLKEEKEALRNEEKALRHELAAVMADQPAGAAERARAIQQRLAVIDVTQKALRDADLCDGKEDDILDSCEYHARLRRAK